MDGETFVENVPPRSFKAGDFFRVRYTAQPDYDMSASVLTREIEPLDTRHPTPDTLRMAQDWDIKLRSNACTLRQGF